MEDAQRQLISALLDHIRSLGLISDSTCDRAVELVYSGMDFPGLFRIPGAEGGGM